MHNIRAGRYSKQSILKCLLKSTITIIKKKYLKRQGGLLSGTELKQKKNIFFFYKIYLNLLLNNNNNNKFKRLQYFKHLKYKKK